MDTMTVESTTITMDTTTMGTTTTEASSIMDSVNLKDNAALQRATAVAEVYVVETMFVFTWDTRVDERVDR